MFLYDLQDKIIMPRHKVHRRLDRLILGREMPHVHLMKDWPYRVLGPRHRIVGHDMFTNILIGLLYGRDAFISAVLHDIADKYYPVKRGGRRRRGGGRAYR